MANGKEPKQSPPSSSPADIRRELKQRAPPSMWTAPQSFIPPPNPAHQVDARRAETYFRRVTVPHRVDGPRPTSWQRAASLSGAILSFSIGIYCVLWYDFGEKEHVFMPVRRALSIDQLNPFRPSEEERKWAQKQGLVVETPAKEEKLV